MNILLDVCSYMCLIHTLHRLLRHFRGPLIQNGFENLSIACKNSCFSLLFANGNFLRGGNVCDSVTEIPY